jgi:hypothetical protein
MIHMFLKKLPFCMGHSIELKCLDKHGAGFAASNMGEWSGTLAQCLSAAGK